MKKFYCMNCGKEIEFKDILSQSVMFGIYCSRCGEVSKASNKTKILFLIIFCSILIGNIFIPISWYSKIIIALAWCVISLWIIQPLICRFK